MRTMIDDPARPSGTKLFYSRPMLIKKRKKSMVKKKTNITVKVAAKKGEIMQFLWAKVATFLRVNKLFTLCFAISGEKGLSRGPVIYRG